MTSKAHILILYTGGTIGMVEEPQNKALKPFDFDHLSDQVPELKKLDCSFEAVSLDNPIDSSDMTPEIWMRLANQIKTSYYDYDGFVVLHGSDTMAYTASALSFIFENLAKPIILTGSQLPIGVIRTDGKENLLTAIQIAAERKPDGTALVNEVAIYFEYKLYRGNRTHKFSAEDFEAFDSPNYPVLAEAGVHIKYNEKNLLPRTNLPFKLNKFSDEEIAILHLFPGIHYTVIDAILNLEDVKAVILYSYGSGNVPTDEAFIEKLAHAIEKGKIILNVTQCQTGAVSQGKYVTSSRLNEIGVIGGKDITIESAVTKLMLLFGQDFTTEEIKNYLSCSLRGEISE